MANRVSNAQLDELLDFLTEHTTLARGVGLGSRSKETIDRQWNDLAIRLNSFGSGSSKTGERWKKYWTDIKHKSKARLAKRRQDALGTGGGPSQQDELSEMDKKILAIIGEQAVYGDIEHRVPIFNNPVQQPEVTISEIPQNTHTHIVLSEENENIHISDTEHSESVAGPSDLSVDTEIQVPEPHQTRVANVAARHPTGSRPRRRRRSSRDTSTSDAHSRIDPEWVKDVEYRRVQAAEKMADAALVIAQGVKCIAEATLSNAEMMKRMVELLCSQRAAREDSI